MQLQKILAIDFETATGARSTPCSVGMAIFDFATGDLIDTVHQLIDPESEFSPFNVRLTGIDETTVHGAPTFPDVLPMIRSRIDKSTLVVAHNASFDTSVLFDTCRRYDMEPPRFDFFCTFKLAKVLLPGMSSYSLPVVAEACGISFHDHHTASADAEACGRLFLHIAKAIDAMDTETIERLSDSSVGMMTPDWKQNCHIGSRSKVSIRSACAHPDLPSAPDPESPFYGRTVVFTGTLLSMTREAAQETIIAIGGKATNSISKKTNYLVTGYLDPHITKEVGKSNKLLKVEQMIADGYDIQILPEEDFLKML